MNTTITEKPLTTFETAKICKVFHTTVINWVNKGKLKAYSTPGGHRRISIPDLIEFMRKYDMPIPEDLLTRHKRVLIVEDDPAVQRMLSRMLQPLHKELDTQTCASGMEALINIGKEAPDLIVLDVRIPQINGLEVCKLLKANENTREVKIIAISGETLSHEDEVFLKAHTDSYFRKPISTTDFKAKVAELLELEIPAAGAARGK